MIPLGAVTLLVNGLTLALSLGFLLIVLWHDSQKELSQFFTIFLGLVTIWNIGSLMAIGFSLIAVESRLLSLAISLMEIGFIGSSIAVYVLTATLVGVHTRRFRILSFTGLAVAMLYQVFLAANNQQATVNAVVDGVLTYRFQVLSAMFYLIFDGMALYLLWRYGRKIHSRGLVIGLWLFIIGQSIGFLNPDLQVTGIAVNAASLAALVISFGMLRQEIITPLAERIVQVEAMHKVSLAVISQLAIDTVLNQIALQAASWLGADGAGIFLNEEGDLHLAAVYNLPRQYLDVKIPLGYGVSGTVAQTRKSIFLENYGRDWKREADLPLAHETFGSVIAVPLVYGNEAIGILMVIAGRHGQLFQVGDVKLLEMLGAQAATAISHSQLFNKQQNLTTQIEAARSQLETVLISTENPVVAVDKEFRLIFANPAARGLVKVDTRDFSQPILNIIPSGLLPRSYRNVWRDVRRNKAHIYEVSLNNKVYLCHLASLGYPKTRGWVAVLNDITQLKELDRLQGEMIRMTSHDLKNPLQAALANLDLLVDDIAHDDFSNVTVTTTIIEKQLLRMNRIISGILDLERVKTTAFSRDICFAHDIVQDTLDELQYIAQDRDITLMCEIGDSLPGFWGNRDQFRRALINLVENSIKFSPMKETVHIRVARKEDFLQFEVEDHGIGIPIALQSYVFDRFFRGGQKGQKDAEHISGSGLGLSLVKAIVENHQGEVWLESQEGLGTTFFVRVPILNQLETSHSQ